MTAKTYIKQSNQSYDEFLMSAVEQAEKDLEGQNPYVIDCPTSLSDNVMNKFKCPIQLSILDDGLTFHLV